MTPPPEPLEEQLGAEHAAAWYPHWSRLLALVAANSARPAPRPERQAEISACCLALARVADDWRCFDLPCYWIQDGPDEMLHAAADLWGRLLTGQLGDSASWDAWDWQALATAAIVLGFSRSELAEAVAGDRSPL